MSNAFPANQVIVVGGGLAGLSAAISVLESGGNVVIIDKMGICGGNSTKASSGINGSGTEAQKRLGIEDSAERFLDDTLKGGSSSRELAGRLTSHSADAVKWLTDKFGLNLTEVSRLGGHSVPRTHRGQERFPGMTITYALLQACESMQQSDVSRCRIVTHAHVTRLVMNGFAVIGVEYKRIDPHKTPESQSKDIYREIGPVILATGGFAADLKDSKLIAKYRPDLLHLPTTNGEHATGDGIKLATDLGADVIDMDAIQVHPTGFVDPKNPENKVKYLAAEALRGEGGFIVNSIGNRFCNELGRRDYITTEIWKNEGPFWLVLPGSITEALPWHIDHYIGMGVLKAVPNIETLAESIKAPFKAIEQTLKELAGAAQKSKEPGTPPYEVKGGQTGKTFDIHGRQFMKEFEITGNFYVGQITPVLHYCMGGISINQDAQVLLRGEKKKKSVPSGHIPGLYACGEVTGGIHGKNRLGGNALLDCVVFGRIAGGNACMQNLTKAESVSKTQQLPWLIKAAPEASQLQPSKLKSYSLTEVATHNKKNDCWIAVNGLVLDFTKFMHEHPGGDLAIITMAGKDSSAEFNMIHPPDVIDKYAQYTIQGVLEEVTVPHVLPKGPPKAPSTEAGPATYSLKDIASHNIKTDCWIGVNGLVLDVTEFMKDHPGGELPILTFAGKDASKEFNMIHPPNVIDKYARYTIKGKLVEHESGVTVYPAAIATAQPPPGEAYPRELGIAAGLTTPLLMTEGQVAAVSSEHWWGPDRITYDDYGPLGPSVYSYMRAFYACIQLVVKEVFKTIFTVKNFTVPHDRSGLTRSAIFLLFYAVIHSLGNLHVYRSAEAFNGYAYFLNHPVFYGALAIPIELYLLASALMHVVVATIRTLKFKSMNMLVDPRLSGQLGLAVTGAALFFFLIVHVSQFRLVSDYPEFGFRSKWMYPFYCDINDPSCEASMFKDLYKMEFQLFESKFWVGFYSVAVVMFALHLQEGLAKVVTISSEVGRRDKNRAKLIGGVMAWGVALVYLSFPIYCYTHPQNWVLYDKSQSAVLERLEPELEAKGVETPGGLTTLHNP